MIQYQILPTNITRSISQTVRRITNEILGVKGLIVCYVIPFSIFFLFLVIIQKVVEIEEIKIRIQINKKCMVESVVNKFLDLANERINDYFLLFILLKGCCTVMILL